MSVILGTGSALGKRFIPAAEIAAATGVSPSWIADRTGITGIHSRDGQPLSDLAIHAASKALAHGHLSEVQRVIVATCTADYILPSMASRVCRALGLTDVMAFDIQANCAGFVDALAASSAMGGTSLVIGAEALYEYADPSSVESVLFVSDGAGAALLGDGGSNHVAACVDGANYESVRCKRGGRVEMQGLATWAQAVKHLPRVCREAVAKAGWDRPDVIVFHQANVRLIEFLASRLDWPGAEVFVNVNRVGNTGAASIPIALAELAEQDRLHGRVLMAGVGAGFGFSAITLEQS